MTIEVNPEEVNVTTAVTELQSGGITPTTTQVDPLVALASVDGVDSGDLTALKRERGERGDSTEAEEERMRWREAEAEEREELDAEAG